MRKFLKVRHLICTSLFFALIFMCSNVCAETYDVIDARIDQNIKMINSANSMGSIFRSSYLDLSLKELAETNYTALTSVQQNELKALADNIILEKKGSNISKIKKIEKFYDWILEKYYYYETPEKIAGLSINRRYDNPYYLLTNEYELYGKVRTRANGFASTLVALARTQNIPARLVGGYYNESEDDYYSWHSVNSKNINHVWVEIFVDNSWKMFDPFADSYKKYDDVANEYIENINNTKDYTEDNEKEENVNDDVNTKSIDTTQMDNTDSNMNLEEDIPEKHYFNPSVEELSQTHIALKTYSGSNSIKYISNNNERKQLKVFLNTKYNGKSNGKRINSSYNTNNSATWFVKNDTNSITNGYGKVKRIYWPSKKSIKGKLNLNSFTSLQTVSLPENKLTSVSITGASSLKKVNVKNNNLSKVVITGSKKINTIKAGSNPLTYAKYCFSSTNKLAVISAGKGGTVSFTYYKTNKGPKHYLVARPKSDYTFVGWYKGNKRVSKKAYFTLIKNSPFTYVAKFKKKPAEPYIKISISSQKLWYYKYGKVAYTSSVVTGQRYVHDTPKGTFKIRGKAKDIYLVGPDYKSFVNFWMPIYGGIGMHDASWRWNFGGDIYKYNGSHGCINMPYKTAKYIYNNVPTGTTVKVVS